MDQEQMVELIERFVRTRVTAPKRSIISKLLLGEGEKSFICRWEKTKHEVAEAVCETVMINTSPKRDTILRCKAFIGWLQQQTGEDYEIEWPPIDVGNSFERIIYPQNARTR